MALVQFVTNVEMDHETIDELHALRAIRIETTKNLLKNIDKTLDDMVSIGSISRDDITTEFTESLKLILKSKLKNLTDRTYQDHFFDDEIALFSDIEVSSVEDGLK
jgi:hypothetical protein